MDPTETELAGITNLAGVYTWAGVTGRLQKALQEALGDPGRVREIALIPLRALSLVEAARVESPCS